jgi:hypothetical protein
MLFSRALGGLYRVDVTIAVRGLRIRQFTLAVATQR